MRPGIPRGGVPMSPAPVSAERLKHLLDNPEHINPRYELSAIITLALEALALRTPSDGEVVAWRGRYEHPGEEPDEWHLFHGKPANGHADWRSYPLYARSHGMEVTDEMVERFMEGWNDSHPEMSHDMRPSVRAGLRSALSPGKE